MTAGVRLVRDRAPGASASTGRRARTSRRLRGTLLATTMLLGAAGCSDGSSAGSTSGASRSGSAGGSGSATSGELPARPLGPSRACPGLPESTAPAPQPITVADLSAAAPEPEGVVVGPDGAAYVSSAKNGAIVRVDPATGKVSTFSAAGADGRDQALGMTVHDGLLVVAGGTTTSVYTYRVDDGKHVATIAADEAFFLNDLTVGPDGRLFVTDTNTGTLFSAPARALTGGTGSLEVLAQVGSGANGIVPHPDGKHLIVALDTRGELVGVDPGTGGITSVEVPEGDSPIADGLLACEDRVLIGRGPRGAIDILQFGADGTNATKVASWTRMCEQCTTLAATADGVLVVDLRAEVLLRF